MREICSDLRMHHTEAVSFKHKPEIYTWEQRGSQHKDNFPVVREPLAWFLQHAIRVLDATRFLLQLGGGHGSHLNPSLPTGGEDASGVDRG